MYIPELHLELHRGELDERARRPRWSPRQPQHPPGWRQVMANRLRSVADRLASPQAVEQRMASASRPRGRNEPAQRRAS